MRRITTLAALAVGAWACNGTLSEGVMAGEGSALPSSVDSGNSGAVPTNGSEGAERALPGVALDGTPVRSRVVRLTHAQWEHSVRDVLQLDGDPGFSSSFTGDPPNGSFSNNERALAVTPNLRLDYQRAAEALSERVTRDAAALAKIFPGAEASEFIASFGRRAYRRELTSDEQARYLALFNLGPSVFESGDGRADGAQLVVETMLQSPHFLYRTELADDGAPLSGYELATKLSFLLRNTTDRKSVV